MTGDEASEMNQNSSFQKGRKRKNETQHMKQKKIKPNNATLQQKDGGNFKIQKANGSFEGKNAGNFKKRPIKQKADGSFEGKNAGNFKKRPMKQKTGGNVEGKNAGNFKKWPMKQKTGGNVEGKNAGNFKKWPMKQKTGGSAEGKNAGNFKKESMKQKTGGSGEGKNEEEKIKLVNMKKKERKLIRKKKENAPTFERGKRLKSLWEELRREDHKPEEKERLLNESIKLIKGHAKELSYAHDTVRVMECVFRLGTDEHKTLLFEELKEVLLQLAKSKYGKFLAMKILQKGSKSQKNFLMNQFHGNVVGLMSHTEAASVVEVAFNECASASQRAELVQEFYGPSYRFFKEANCHSLKQLLEKEPEKKEAIVKHMGATLVKILQKNVFKHSIIHFILHEFFVHADSNTRSDVIEAARQLVVEMLHTKDGARAAMHCLWYGTAKDRKVIIKSFKSHVAKIAKEEFGHMALLALFDCVDDTKLVGKHIIAELSNDLADIISSNHGRKVLIYLLVARDSVHFHPDVIKILKEGDKNETSKKDAEIRRNELKQFIIAPLVKAVAENVSKLYTDNSNCIFIMTVVKNAEGVSTEATKAIAQLASVPYSNETKNTHIVESPGSFYMLKMIITSENKSDKTDTFSEVFVNDVCPKAMKSWITCNRGCFLLVSLLETEIPAVVAKVKETMHGLHKTISKKTFKGAEILLRKLKS